MTDDIIAKPADILSALDALKADISALPWRHAPHGIGDIIFGAPSVAVDPAVVSMEVGPLDARFIVALVNSYDALRAELIRLRQQENELLAARACAEWATDAVGFMHDGCGCPGCTARWAKGDTVVDAWRAARGEGTK